MDHFNCNALGENWIFSLRIGTDTWLNLNENNFAVLSSWPRWASPGRPWLRLWMIHYKLWVRIKIIWYFGSIAGSMNTEQNCHHDLLPGRDPLPPVREENCDTESWRPSLVSRERETISAESDLTIHKIRILPVLEGNWVCNYLTMFDWGYLWLVPASCHPDIGDIHPQLLNDTIIIDFLPFFESICIHTHTNAQQIKDIFLWKGWTY